MSSSVAQLKFMLNQSFPSLQLFMRPENREGHEFTRATNR
jgi:hypothetical protein